MSDELNKGYFDINKDSNVEAKCKKCGNKHYAKDFRIDDDTGMMVCPNCFRNTSLKKTNSKELIKKITEPKVAPEEPPRTVVIRDEDNLENNFFNRPKKIEKVEVKKDDRVILTCDRCGFRFRFNPKKNWPLGCPSCNRSINQIKKRERIIY